MAYPGIVLFFGVGIGIALLYYVFSDKDPERSHAYSANTRSPSSYDNWTTGQDRSRARDRRDSSSSLRNREGRDTCKGQDRRARDRRDSSSSLRNREGRDTCKDDTDCSICLEPLSKSKAEVKQLLPCKHYFHLSCINALRNHNAQAVCPNCRNNINQVQ
ncbi:E3 ubiquitin-protein ligase ATL42-like isoform X2 [Pseudomyrmex gracilis]|uniref:E3 ubiquitin-protein ligase ATL42-like isoform X2 n=1 Tax=Pseudomyrmex gracilis TaxID=219809 RepID=UPI000995576E|nr:E3 ubiquitin-protein ligase ATL42-like isoform X2 [Pseudomyrmex gracilis]